MRSLFDGVAPSRHLQKVDQAGVQLLPMLSFFMRSTSLSTMRPTISTQELAFETAVQYGSPETVALFVKHGASLTRVRYNGWTLLMTAADKGNTKVMKMLIERGAVVSEQHDGWSVTHCAAMSGKSDAIRVVLEHGGDVNVTRAADMYTEKGAAKLTSVRHHASRCAAARHKATQQPYRSRPLRTTSSALCCHSSRQP